MKRFIKDFSVRVIGKDVHVNITSDRKKTHSYRIWTDARHPNIVDVAKELDQCLGEAKQLSSRVEINEYFERMYVFINGEQYSTAER